MDEPLNLTIKKRPVAIVAPSSVVDSYQNTIVHKTVNRDKAPTDKPEDIPQDLSLKHLKSDFDESTPTDKQNNNKFNNHEELRKYLSKDEVVKNNSYNKNSFTENIHDLKTNIFKDIYKMNDFYEKNLASPDNIYSMINHLAEHKFLTAWYMNSVLNMNLPYLNLNKQPSSYDVNSTNSAANNSILNNLLNKKPSTDVNFDTLIKNEMRPEKTTTTTTTSSTDRTQVDQKNNVGDGKNNQDSNNAADKKKPHIKKPLNAFMLYMKEMRAKVVAECTLKESAAINQILGRKWHALGREEQAKYYELARRERQLHMQLYPDWSSRANATRGKKRKRKQDPADGGNSMKKCRARYGLDQQSQWCKPCSPENSSLSGGSSGVHASLLHSAGGPASTQSPQEPTYVNL